MVSTATEARDSFVAHSQSDKCGLIEIEGKSGFRSRAILVDQATVDPYVAFTETQERHTVFLIPVAKWSDGTAASMDEH
jgi:hypothetical protein